mgnify:CR=1 FL=1
MERLSLGDLLGTPPETATAADIDRFSPAGLRQLFHAATAPELAEMKGEYPARLVRTGLLYPLNFVYAHTLMGPGYWEAKAFWPETETRGWGYNRFRRRKKEGGVICRVMKMDTQVGPSRFDDKDSFHLVYAAHNRGRNHSMRDEIRRIHPTLYLGFGCLAWALDRRNPVPFLLHGEPASWVGPDNGR